MICQCFKCGHANEVLDDDILDGCESYQCHACMNLAFVPNVGLYRYMARTVMNEPQAYSDLASGETWTVDGFVVP